MFIQNKYANWYFKIIDAARSQRRKRGETYYENHHIQPRSLGGSNRQSNLVLLTGKEHFICHLLLTKMTEGTHRYKMACAMWNMSHNPGNSEQRRYKLSSKSYEMTRRMYSEMSKGRKCSEEKKAKLRESCRKNPHIMRGEDNPEFVGYFHTPWGKFATAIDAERKCPYGLEYHRISNSCKKPDTKIQQRRPSTIPAEWVGKTHKELGFWFEKTDT